MLKGSANVEQQIVQKTESEQLVATIERLPPKYKDVLLLYYFAEMSLQEIADALHISINTVKTRLVRARKQLKVELEEGGDAHAID